MKIILLIDYKSQYTLIYKYGNCTHQLKFRKGAKNFLSRNNGGQQKSLAAELKEKEVIELLENAGSIKIKPQNMA